MTKKELYTVALYKDAEGQYYVFNSKGKLDMIEVFEEQFLRVNKYTMVTCVVTTEKVVALKARLKFRIEELKALKEDTDYYGYDDTVKRSIGLLVSRLLREGVDVTDEVALQCYDYRYRNMV